MKFVTEVDVLAETGVVLAMEEASRLISEASFTVARIIQPNIIDETAPDTYIKSATAQMVAHLKKYGSVLEIGSFSLGGLSLSGSNSKNSIPTVPNSVMNMLSAGGYLYRGLS